MFVIKRAFLTSDCTPKSFNMAEKMMHAVQYDSYGGGAAGLKVSSISHLVNNFRVPSKFGDPHDKKF